jgi:thiol:disulfide interchange protein
MSKKFLVPAVLAVLISGGIVLLINTNLFSTERSQASDTLSKIPWLSDYKAALAKAKAENKLVVIDFYATWCGPCKMLDQNTFTDQQVHQKINGFVPLKIDVDQQRAIAAQYRIQSLPTSAIINADGQLLSSAIGYMDANRYLEFLANAKSP